MVEVVVWGLVVAAAATTGVDDLDLASRAPRPLPPPPQRLATVRKPRGPFAD
jgi:hypothetical protein